MENKGILLWAGALVLCFSFIISACVYDHDHPQTKTFYYHTIKFVHEKNNWPDLLNGEETVDLPLVAYNDRTDTESSLNGFFVLGSGGIHGTTTSELYYNVLVMLPDSTVKPMKLNSDYTVIKYSENPRITMNKTRMFKLIDESVKPCLSGSKVRASEVVIEIPKNTIVYENMIDGE